MTKIMREPTFNAPLFLFDKDGEQLKPIKKIQLTKEQKDLIIKEGFIYMRKKTFFVLATDNNALVNVGKRDLYKTVIDVINDEILILGLYKAEIEKEETNGPH